MRIVNQLMRIVGILLLVTEFAGEARAQQQSVVLHQGWNLVGWVVQPADASVRAVLGDAVMARVVRVYGYDGNAMRWDLHDPTPAVGLPPLTTLQTLRGGHGYWILLSNGPDVTVQVGGAVSPVAAQTLGTGWHLVAPGHGFWADVFGSAAANVEALIAYDPGTHNFYGFEGPRFDQADVDGDGVVRVGEFGWTYTSEFQSPSLQLRDLRDGQAYWVRVRQETLLAPQLDLALEGDIDAPVACPAGATTDCNTWNPAGTYDTDINGNGILDYGRTVLGSSGQPVTDAYGHPIVRTQDTIWFRQPKGPSYAAPITEQHLTVLNRGTGSLSFAVTFTPATGQAVDTVVARPASGQALPGVVGVPITLLVDYGKFTGAGNVPIGTLQVTSNAGVETLAVMATAPQLGGTWRGALYLTSSNGEPMQLSRQTLAVAFRDASKVELLPSRSLFLTAQCIGGASSGLDCTAQNQCPGGTCPPSLELFGTVANNTFSVEGTLLMAASASGNPFGVAVTRRLKLTGRFAKSGQVSVDEARAALAQVGGVPVLFGDYEDRIEGAGVSAATLRGLFQLSPVAR